MKAAYWNSTLRQPIKLLNGDCVREGARCRSAVHPLDSERLTSRRLTAEDAALEEVYKLSKKFTL